MQILRLVDSDLQKCNSSHKLQANYVFLLHSAHLKSELLFDISKIQWRRALVSYLHLAF